MMLAPNEPSRQSLDDGPHGPELTMSRTPPRVFGINSLFRHKWIIGLGAVLGVLVGLLYTMTRQTTYTASIELLVYNRQIATGPAAVVLPGRVDIPLVQNQIQVLQSRAVLTKVIDALDLTNDPEFFSRREHGLLRWLKELVIPQPQQLVDGKTLAFVQTLEELRRNINIVRVGASHIVRMDVRSSDPRKAVKIIDEIARAYLQERRARGMGDVSAIRELYQGLGPSGYLVSEVQPPMRPSGLPDIIVILGAILLGIGSGAVAAVLLDVISNRIRSPEQLEYCLGVPCLSIVPAASAERRVSSSNRQSDATPVIQHYDAEFAAAFARLTSALQEEGFPNLRSLGVTSAVPGDGATTIAQHLARSMTVSGRKVLLIENAPTVLDDIVREAMETYEFVIVDLPSLASSAKARAAARILDGLLLTVKWDATDCRLASQALQSAVEAQAKFVGAVLNCADERTMRIYGDQSPPSFGALANPAVGRGHAWSRELACADTGAPDCVKLTERV